MNRIQLSFKDAERDAKLYEFLTSKKDTIGISTYIKLLIEQDMEKVRKSRD